MVKSAKWWKNQVKMKSVWSLWHSCTSLSQAVELVSLEYLPEDFETLSGLLKIVDEDINSTSRRTTANAVVGPVLSIVAIVVVVVVVVGCVDGVIRVGTMPCPVAGWSRIGRRFARDISDC